MTRGRGNSPTMPPSGERVASPKRLAMMSHLNAPAALMAGRLPSVFDDRSSIIRTIHPEWDYTYAANPFSLPP
jgi:hypothetical protein